MSLDANWQIYNGGRVAIAKDQLSQNVLNEKLIKDAAIHDLIKAVYQSYYNVLFQIERQKLLAQNLILSKDRLEYEKVKREFGASNSYNLIQFETSIITDSTAIKEQIVKSEIAQRELYQVLDIYGFKEYRYLEELPMQDEEIDRDKLIDILEEDNFTLKTLQLNIALNALNTQLEKTAKKPTVNLGGSLGFTESAFKFFEENPSTGNTFPLQWSNQIRFALSASANWNLYDGGLRDSNIEAAKLQEEMTQISFLEAKAELSNQLDILIANFNNQKELLILADEQIKIANKNLDMTEERFKAGLINSLDFRNVQNQYLMASFNKVNVLYNMVIAKSEIDWLIGRFKASK